MKERKRKKESTREERETSPFRACMAKVVVSNYLKEGNGKGKQ